MRNSDIALTDIFLTYREGAGTDERSLLEEDDHIKMVQNEIDKRVHAKEVPSVVVKISEYIEPMLHVSIKDILLNGWKNYKKISEALERSRKTPDKTLFLSLAKHTMDSDHHPYIEIDLNGEEIEKIIFEIKLQLILEGFILEIKKGEIRAINTGVLTATGKVAHHNAVLFEKKSDKIKLPGKIVLD